MTVITATTGRFFFQAEDGIRDLTVTGVQTCALPISAQICAQATGVEDRQMQRRPDTGDAASGAEQIQPLQAGGAEADEPGEIDVREEIGLRGADLRRRGLETPALGRDIGPASQQIRRQVRGEGERLAVRLQRELDLQRRIRAQAEQRGELMPIELNGRLGGGNLDTRSSDLLVRLPDRDPRL